MTGQKLTQVAIKSCWTPRYDVSNPVQGSIRVFASAASPSFRVEANSL